MVFARTMVTAGTWGFPILTGRSVLSKTKQKHSDLWKKKVKRTQVSLSWISFCWGKQPVKFGRLPGLPRCLFHLLLGKIFIRWTVLSLWRKGEGVVWNKHRAFLLCFQYDITTDQWSMTTLFSCMLFPAVLKNECTLSQCTHTCASKSFCPFFYFCSSEYQSFANREVFLIKSQNLSVLPGHWKVL